MKCAECGRRRDSLRWLFIEQSKNIHEPTEEEIKEAVKLLKAMGVIFNN